MSELPADFNNADSHAKIIQRLNRLEDLVRHQQRMITVLGVVVLGLLLTNGKLGAIFTTELFLFLLGFGSLYVLYAVFVKPSLSPEREGRR